MKSIELYINNIGNNINVLIDVQNNKLTINNKEKNIKADQIDELIRIIRNWSSVYKDTNNILDSQKFTIKVNTDEGTDVIKGEGKYPDNYNLLIDWISDFYD